jgi:hypothetical protein
LVPHCCKAVVTRRSDPCDASELGKAAIGTATGKDGNDVDGFRDQRSRDGHDRFLDELLKAAQRTEGGAGMDGADTAGMTRAPRTSPIGMRSGRKRSDERTRSDSDTTPSLVRAARFGALH